MNLRLIDKYVELCRKFNKPVTWRGLQLFNASLKEVC